MSTIKIVNHNMQNTVNVYLAGNIVDWKTIVVVKTSDGLKIREASISDKKTLTIRKENSFSFTCADSKELIGEYDFELEDGFLYLTKKSN